MPKITQKPFVVLITYRDGSIDIPFQTQERAISFAQGFKTAYFKNLENNIVEISQTKNPYYDRGSEFMYKFFEWAYREEVSIKEMTFEVINVDF